MSRKPIGRVILIIVLGALIGSLTGQLIGLVLPEGVVKDFFLKSASASVGPATINIIIMTFTIGFSIKLNVTGIIGILIAAYALRWVD